jgi:hypothetical protein
VLDPGHCTGGEAGGGRKDHSVLNGADTGDGPRVHGTHACKIQTLFILLIIICNMKQTKYTYEIF